MPATFSINSGQLTESTRKPNIFTVLNDIQDNTQKLISPRDVRDAFLSTWANSPFKLTTPNSLANYEYIGIDSNDPGNKDIKQKILLGKRSYGNLDIMSSSLLGSDTDIFLFNTKPDTVTQSSTKISILAGTNSSLYNLAPYIQSKVNNTGIDLNIINPGTGSSINLLSTSGRVSINQVVFPTVAETFGSASDGRILRYRGTYPSGYLKWEDPTVTLNVLGTPGYSTTIYGSSVSVNGYPIEFIDPDYVPSDIGGIQMGMSYSHNSFFNGTTYQNWPVTEVLKELLYPYVAPVLELSVVNTITGTNYAEVGTTASAVLTYKITTYQRNYNERICNYQVTKTNYTGLSFSAVPGSFITATISSPTYSSVEDSRSWTLQASNSGSLLTFSYSSVTSIQYIYPIYYGFTSSLITNSTSFQTIAPILNKIIIPIGGTISLPISGDGYLYFIYKPGYKNYPRLDRVIDPNGFIIHESSDPNYSAFIYNYIQYPLDSTHPTTGYPKSFFVYRSKYQCSYPGPNNTSGGFINTTGNFQFTFIPDPSIELI